MADTDYDKATASAPFFTVGPGAEGQGLSTTTQFTALNEQTTGVADDLAGQNSDITTALDAITAALVAKPAA